MKKNRPIKNQRRRTKGLLLAVYRTFGENQFSYIKVNGKSYLSISTRQSKRMYSIVKEVKKGQSESKSGQMQKMRMNIGVE